MRKAFILILLLSMITCTYALETGSGHFMVDFFGFVNGGGPAASANNIADFSQVGSNFGASGALLSPNYILQIGPAYLLSIPLPKGEAPWISEIIAKTDVLGPIIPEATWQKDNDPYFYWEIIVQPPMFISGFSVSQDARPDLTIDTYDAHYQLPENSMVSGKHAFYVVPINSAGLAESDSLRQFNIWVDVDLPQASQLSPAPGALLKTRRAPITCYLSDSHSGLNLNLTVLSLNNQPVIYSFDPKKGILEYAPSADFPEGKNTVALQAQDIAGNKLLKVWDFIVDTRPPTGKISINGGEEVAHSAYAQINIDARDEVSGVKNIYLSNDGIFDQELSHPYPYAPVIRYWLMADPDVDGEKTVYARFEDEAGNRSEVYKDTIMLRLLTPDTRIISGPKSITADTSANFAFEANKPNCKFSFKLDNQNWPDWSTGQTANFSGLGEGNHYFYAKSALDLNGDGQITIDEEDATPAQWVWTVKPEGYLEKLKERILFWKR